MRFKFTVALFLVSSSISFVEAAIDIIFDYSYDSNNWFGDEQRYIMDQVAYVYESRLGSESFAGYRPNEDLGLSTVSASLALTNPSTAASLNITVGSTTADGNVIGRQDELVIFLGARTHGFSSSSVLATAGPTGSSWSYSDATEASTFGARLSSKNNSTNFEPLAGSSQVNSAQSFYFDTDLTTHDDLVTGAGANLTDFYSVMVHEIGHVMGFIGNFSQAWAANSSGGFWTGQNAKDEYGDGTQDIPLYDDAHWDLPTDEPPSNSGDLVPGSVKCACHPSMLPTIGRGTRTSFTDLDFALLKDLGYSISSAPSGTLGPGGSNSNSYTDPDWGGTFDIPIKESYSNWLLTNATGIVGGEIMPASAAPEPAFLFSFMGGFFALFYGRKNLFKLKNKFFPSST